MIRFVSYTPYHFRVKGAIRFVGLRYKKFIRIEATRYYHEWK